MFTQKIFVIFVSFIKYIINAATGKLLKDSHLKNSAHTVK